ncbi:MAG: hypothetical protein ACM3PV_04885 [Betaproteobacteria bacterium]
MTANHGYRWLRPAGACLLLVLSACGSDNPATTPTTTPPTTTTTTTTQPAGSVVLQGNAPILAAKLYLVDVTTGQDGRIDVTIDYAFADSQVLMWLTNRQCNYKLFEADGCDYLVKSLGGSKPRTMSASDVKAGTYSLFIANDGPHDEQVSYTVSLTSSAGALGSLSLGPGALRPRH